MNIDWSKAPHGTMGYHPLKNGYVDHWVKWEPNGDNWFCVIGFEDGGWVKSHSRMSEKYLAEIVDVPVTWNGEGWPPVGTVCEFKSTQHGPCEFESVEVMYVSDVTVVARRIDISKGDATELLCHPGTARFRPIRTPEQIAAEEREKAADSLYLTMWPNDTLHECEAGNPKWNACFKAIDAGYRKQVAP